MRLLITAMVCLALPSLAQEDDLAPLAQPAKPKPKPPVAKPKPAAAKIKPGTPKGRPAVVVDDDLAPLPVSKGELIVKVLPATVTGATVFVDGKEQGPAPSTQPVAPGEHTVSVKRPGFANFVKKVTIGANKQVEVDARLTATLAVLTITSDVPDAQVLISNKLIGMTPIADREWPPGTFEVTVRKDGFKDDRQMLTFAAGRDYPVAVRFKPVAVAVAPALPSDRPLETSLVPGTSSDAPLDVTATSDQGAPVYKRWYFWAGIAAVVAAGVGVGVAVNQANAAPRPSVLQDFRDKCATLANCTTIDRCLNVDCNATRLNSSGGVSF